MSTLADQEDSLPYQGHQQTTHPLSIVSFCPGYMWHEPHVTNLMGHLYAWLTWVHASWMEHHGNSFRASIRKPRHLYFLLAVMCDGFTENEWGNVTIRSLWLWYKRANWGLSQEERVGGLWPRRCSPGRDQSDFHWADRWRNLISRNHDVIMYYNVYVSRLRSSGAGGVRWTYRWRKILLCWAILTW